ncbi:Putative transposase, YhgA-like [Pseudobutyrivibrio sp. YE44]|uniref:Rpn family recombination-promoting nuclease/putative transposase n=1 Tax=Pseudobutyrivibrio sp. YE44 TaxID=1520802 RepID=UPI0008905AA1|nr:Rpn family recombination-promoting nuclease/putative transposase [Pseudobutyrivibrio sp. YE44]SDB07854.1 Putative transposase, YhgA-like [Pseudobutyrivibrio sp. YE44]
MGNKDVITKSYMRNPEIFADFFNGYIYNGETKIDWKTLEEIDTASLSVIPFASGRKSKGIEKYRDIIKRTIIMRDSSCYYAILGIENQTDIHYAMPVRNMLYDALSYAEQVDGVKKQKRIKGGFSDDDFLSGFSLEDKLTPVITVTVYWGTKNWNAPTSIKQMFNAVDPQMEPFINDYFINLFSIIDLVNVPDFKTELRQLFLLLNTRNDDVKMQELVNTDNSFEHISRKTAELMRDFASIKLPRKSKEGDYNMCKAIMEIERKSKEQGLEQGKELEREKSIKELMKNLNFTEEQARAALGLSSLAEQE